MSEGSGSSTVGGGPDVPDPPSARQRESHGTMLATIPSPKGVEVSIQTDELTMFGLPDQPDFGTLTVTYVTNARSIELRSFKKYVGGYRDVGLSYERLVHNVAADISSAVQPTRLVVTASFHPRGGSSTTTTYELEAEA